MMEFQVKGDIARWVRNKETNAWQLLFEADPETRLSDQVGAGMTRQVTLLKGGQPQEIIEVKLTSKVFDGTSRRPVSVQMAYCERVKPDPGPRPDELAPPELSAPF